MGKLCLDLGGVHRHFSVALGIVPLVALKHGGMKAGPSGMGGETGEGEDKEGEETGNAKKAIIHFSLSFQALSHIKAFQR